MDTVAKITPSFRPRVALLWPGAASCFERQPEQTTAPNSA